MKIVKLDEATILSGAKAAKTTPEKFVSDIISISSGRGVCAHFQKREGGKLVFSLSRGVRTPRRTRDSKRNKSGVYLCVHAGRKNGLDVFEDIPPVKPTRNRKAVAV